MLEEEGQELWIELCRLGSMLLLCCRACAIACLYGAFNHSAIGRYDLDIGGRILQLC